MNLRIVDVDPQGEVALSLYEAFGFYRIAPYGAHDDDPTSVCFELPLYV